MAVLDHSSRRDAGKSRLDCGRCGHGSRHHYRQVGPGLTVRFPCTYPARRRTAVCPCTDYEPGDGVHAALAVP